MKTQLRKADLDDLGGRFNMTLIDGYVPIDKAKFQISCFTCIMYIALKLKNYWTFFVKFSVILVRRDDSIGDGIPAYRGYSFGSLCSLVTLIADSNSILRFSFFQDL